MQTGRETTQSQLDHLRYWASGLSPDYLVYALARARPSHSTSPAAPPPLEEPTYDAARILELQPAADGAASRHRFVLQFGSENAAAVLANHVWSEESVTLPVRGRKVALTNYDLAEALRAQL